MAWYTLAVGCAQRPPGQHVLNNQREPGHRRRAAPLACPYGEERWTNGTLPTDYTYTGQRNEAGLGLMDYKARYYSPYLGRFISPDTLVPGVGSQAFNRYMYVGGNPIGYRDPSGHYLEPGEFGIQSPAWFMDYYYEDTAKALNEAERWFDAHPDYNLYNDPQVWTSDNGELAVKGNYGGLAQS